MANLVQNGSFENGTLVGWSFNHGIVGKVQPMFSQTWKRKRYFNNPPNQIQPRIVDIATLYPELSQSIVPLEGNRMLQINDIAGDKNVTECYQDITLPQNMIMECARLTFAWATILQGSGHEDYERPMFIVKIERKKNNNWKEFQSFEFVAPDNGSDGWTNIAAPDQVDEHWFKSGNESYSLASLSPGDEIRIMFTAEDCTDGAHGGTAFIDAVHIDNICDDPGEHNSPIIVDPIPNVFSPNGDGVNDIWGLNNLENACVVETEIFNRWGRRVFYSKKVNCDGVWPGFLPIWDGMISPKSSGGCLGCAKKTERMITQDDMKNGTVYYVLKLKNCHETREETGNITVFL